MKRAGTIAELDAARVLAVPIAPDASGTPRDGLVVRDDAGAVRAYVNRCQHLPIPLAIRPRSGGPARYLDDDGRFLMCSTHGALYRLDDGYCFAGPCRGDALERLDVRVDETGTIWISEDAPPL